MSYRIELMFVGDAPESELERAHILADPTVSQAVKDLSRALEAVGFSHEVTAKTVRAVPRKRKAKTADELALDTLNSPTMVNYVNSRSAAE